MMGIRGSETKVKILEEPKLKWLIFLKATNIFKLLFFSIIINQGSRLSKRRGVVYYYYKESDHC